MLQQVILVVVAMMLGMTLVFAVQKYMRSLVPVYHCPSYKVLQW